MTYFNLWHFFYISVKTTATDFKLGAHIAYRQYYQRLQNKVTGVEN